MRESYIDKKLTSETIREAIQQSGMPQAQIARKMGISPVMVSRWTKGKHVPDTDYLVHLSDILSVSVDKLIIRKKL